VGAIKLGQAGGEVFLGRDMGHERDYSESVAGIIDEEVRRLVEAAHDEAWEVLTQYREVLDNLVLELLEKETLNQHQLAEVFEPVQKRDLRPVWLSSQERQVSDIPPVAMPEKALISADPEHVEEQEKIDDLAPGDQAAAAHEGQRAVEEPEVEVGPGEEPGVEPGVEPGAEPGTDPAGGPDDVPGRGPGEDPEPDPEPGPESGPRED